MRKSTHKCSEEEKNSATIDGEAYESKVADTWLIKDLDSLQSDCCSTDPI